MPFFLDYRLYPYPLSGNRLQLKTRLILETRLLFETRLLLEVVGYNNQKQESHAVAREPRDAAAVVFGLKFADNTRYKFKSSQASKAKLQSSKLTRAKQFNAKWPF